MYMYIVSFAYEYTSGIIWLYLLGHVTIHPQVLPLSIYPSSITTSFVPILIFSENVGLGETFLYHRASSGSLLHKRRHGKGSLRRRKDPHWHCRRTQNVFLFVYVFHVFFTAKSLKVKAKAPEGPTAVLQSNISKNV